MDTPEQTVAAVNLLSKINRLMLRVFSTASSESLTFLIVNDSIQVTRYDRAILFDISGKKNRLLAVSGQAKIKKNSELATVWNRLIFNLKEPAIIQKVSDESFTSEIDLWKHFQDEYNNPSVLWYPLRYQDNAPLLALWLERWDNQAWNEEDIELLHPLAESYAIAWEKFAPKRIHRLWSDYRVLYLIPLLLLAMYLIKVPLRIAAPCEIIPVKSIAITSPLEEIIEKVSVTPGEFVKKGDPLFEFDKRVPLQNLKIILEQQKIAKQDLDRAKGLAFKDEKSISEIGVLEGKLKKENADLALAKYKASLLTVKAPIDGIVIMDDPNQWRGKPVRIGEKILSLSPADQTKIRLWVPENDNVALDFSKPITIVLNVSPEVSREAKLVYISNVAGMHDNKFSNYIGEAVWLKPQPDIRLGLKGTAILYGEDVSLIYWILRKPWAQVRAILGL